MKFNEARKIQQAINEFNRALPLMVNDMGQTALNHFNKSFRDQGFTDNRLVRWKERQRPERGRAILVKSGRLRRSLRKRNIGNLSVRITSNVEYADVHNDGLRSGRGAGFKMPQRQFVGNSAVMFRAIKMKIIQRIRRIFPK